MAMAATMEARRKLVMTRRPWNKALPQGIHKQGNNRNPGQKKPWSQRHYSKVSALQLLRRYQKKASGLLFGKLPFRHFTKSLAHNIDKNLRFQKPAALALQVACQAYLLELSEDWNLCALHAKRVTVLNSDLHLARCLRREMMMI